MALLLYFPQFCPSFQIYTPKMTSALFTRVLTPTLRKGARSFASVASQIQPAVIRPSPLEVEKGSLDARNLEKAVRHMHQDGLVVVEDLVPHDQLDILNEKMIEDAKALQALGDKGPFNYNQGNLQQDAPPVAKYFFPSIFTSSSPLLASRVTWKSTDYRRPNCYSSCIVCSRTSTEMDLLLRKLSNAGSTWSQSSTTASALRR